ncbi:MAG: hypothetical protein ASARMPRED_001329 [Alectoria sarmentosa]|nr:MAG: hypothetical protein ASARMPRED_001329 [Alectoria sarmentosa]
MSKARPDIMPGQALDEPTVASNTLYRRPSSSGPAISTALSSQGTKRKASHMDNIEPSQGTSQTCPPIKQESASPHPFDYRGSTSRDTYTELYGMPTGYASSSSSDETEDQILDIHEDDGTTTTGPSRTPLAAEGQLNMSSRGVSAPLKQEAETHTARVALQNNGGKPNGLLRPVPMLDNFPSPRRQKASRRPEHCRRYTGNEVGDLAFNSIPDYAPPISTLPSGNPHILQVEWRQKILVDLSNDPDRHMLHEAELKLATSLNLSCAKYLCTKRRIFQARFEALQAGRKFRRSDSQKACKINSNKAVKLCGAFEKVGWFDEKYFLKYLDKNNNPLRKANNEDKERGSLSSGLTEPDIWDVSESEFHFTSEGDEESTDDDTANSSVSFDSRHEETAGRRNLDSYQDNSLRKQHHGLSLIGGDGSQRRVLIDRTVRIDDTLSVDESVDEDPIIEDRRPRRRVIAQGAMYPANPDSLSGNETEETPLLETRSGTEKIKLALNPRSGDDSDRLSIVEAKNDQQKLTLENRHRRSAIPHSLDEASAADTMLVRMREEGRSWLEIEEAWEKRTGKAQRQRTLSRRYARIRANLASTRFEPDEVRDDSSSNLPGLSSLKGDQLLLAAEAEVEENFQREKADLIAEIENSFQLEKWNLVAEVMSRSGSTHYSADMIQAQYDMLARGSKRADPKEENPDTFNELPRRITRTGGGRKTETSIPSKTRVGRFAEDSNIPNLPQHRPRLLLYQKSPESKSQASTTIREKSAIKTRKCVRCGRKYKSRSGILNHLQNHPNCDLTTPRPYKSKKRKLNSYSNPGHTQPRDGRHGRFTDPPAPRVSFPNLMPRETTTGLSQVKNIDNTPALEDVSLGTCAEEADHGRPRVRRTKPVVNVEQSARMLRVWAKRRALGTSGQHGGPPRASTIARNATTDVPNAAPNSGISLAPPVTYQSGLSLDSMPNPTQPVVFKKQVRRDVNQHEQSLAQIIPAAPERDGGPNRKSSKKVRIYPKSARSAVDQT